MNFTPLTTISPIDGRYHEKTASLSKYFSEWALFKYRVWVEVEYFIALTQTDVPALAGFSDEKNEALRSLYREFSHADAEKIKTIERITNHDVKAVEYWLKERFEKLGLGEFKEYIHFGLTSQDVNNTSIPMSIRDAVQEVMVPQLKELTNKLGKLGNDLAHIPLLARTHGQPASPTRLGKEILVFVERLDRQLSQLEAVPYCAKFGGATGNFNAHKVAFPKVDWVSFGNSFTEKHLGLERYQLTTQIEH